MGKCGAIVTVIVIIFLIVKIIMICLIINNKKKLTKYYERFMDIVNHNIHRAASKNDDGAAALNNTLQGGYAQNEIRLNNPVPLSYNDVKYVTSHKYVWLEKTDGERTLFDDGHNKIDCEKYNGNLYAFDALFVNDEDIRHFTYTERMSKIKQAKNLPTGIYEKRYYEFNDINEILKFVNSNSISPSTGNNIDGVILQEVNAKYNEARIFKVKPTYMNTIDFLYKLITPNKFVLYLAGEGFVSFSSKSFPKIDSNSLFKSPYSKNIAIVDINADINSKLFNKETIKNYKELISMIKKKPKDFDGKIIETGFDGKKYFPIRIRADKQRANYYYVGIHNIGLIYAPLDKFMDKGKAYFENSLSAEFSQETINNFHVNSKNVRASIFNMLRYNGKMKSCLDLACGRGGDIYYLVKNNFTNLFCVDNDKVALVTLANRAYDRGMMFHKWLNVIDYDLTKPTDKLCTDIMERKEYNKKCFDLILINFAIHYLSGNLREIHKLVKRLSNKNTRFAFTFFDGDYILDHPNETYGEFKITVKRVGGDYIGRFPLPTIDSSGYREEPLVLRRNLDVFGKNFKEYTHLSKDPYFKLIVLRIYSGV